MQPRHDSKVVDAAMRALERGELECACALFRRAIVERPLNAAFHNNYGVALLKRGHLDDAKCEFERAVQLRPDYPDALANYARVTLTLLARLANDSDSKLSARDLKRREAEGYALVERALQKATRLAPCHVDALMTFALLRERQNRYVESAALLERAAPFHARPELVATLIAEQYANARDWSNAARALESALENEATQEATSKLADYYALAGKREKSKTMFRRLSPERSVGDERIGYRSPRAWKYLGLCPLYFETSREIDEYWRVLSDELDDAVSTKRRFDWRTLPSEGFTPSFQLAHHNRCCREIKEKFTRFYEPSFVVERERHPLSARTSRRFRVGFLVSPGAEGGFLRSMAGVISQFNPKDWETVLIHRSATSLSFSNLQVDERLELSDNFESATDAIRELHCDAIYYWKVGGTTWDYFLPMLRLAPVQLASWGVHGTTGVDQIDYFLSQKSAESENAQEHYTEKLVLFSEAPIFQPRIKELPKITREELGLPSSGALYFCPHRPAKYHPDFDLYLKEILERDQFGRIIVLLGDRGDFVSEQIKGRITRKVGATLAKRILFISRLSPRRYGHLFSVATVLLDSCVYSGCVTLYDAIQRGVPCVSQIGELLIQRFPLAAYRAMGVSAPPLAQTREDYVANAVKIGTEPDYRQALSDAFLTYGERVLERRQAVKEFHDFLACAIDSSRRAQTL